MIERLILFLSWFISNITTKNFSNIAWNKPTPFGSRTSSTVGLDKDLSWLEGMSFLAWAFAEEGDTFQAWTLTSVRVVPLVCFEGALPGATNVDVLTSLIGKAFSRFRFWASKSFLKFLWFLFSGRLVFSDSSIPWFVLPASTVFRFLLFLSVFGILFFWNNSLIMIT